MSATPSMTSARVRTLLATVITSSTVLPPRAPSSAAAEITATASGWLSLSPSCFRFRATSAIMWMTSLSRSRGVKCMTAASSLLSGRPSTHREARESDSGHALRALVGNVRGGDLLKPAVGLDRVADQLRGVRVQLVEEGPGRAYPVVGYAAGEIAVECPERAVPRHLRARRVLGNGNDVPLDPEAGDVAVPEVGREHHPVIGGKRKPAQLARLAHTRVDLQVPVLIDPAQGNPVSDGVPQNEVIGPVVQELHVPRRPAATVLVLRLPQRPVRADREHDQPVRVGQVRGD